MCGLCSLPYFESSTTPFDTIKIPPGWGDKCGRIPYGVRETGERLDSKMKVDNKFGVSIAMEEGE